MVLENAALNEAQNSLFVIEDLKPGRRRWLRFELPRSTVEDFVLFNEHNSKEQGHALLGELKKGKNIYLMSDGGLPAFCDPGKDLVKLCHDNNIRVTSTPFPNSISLALALSGLDHNKFIFEGFLPIEKTERKSELKRVLAGKMTTIIMDTPYRLKRLLEEIVEIGNREIFLALDLGSKEEALYSCSASQCLKKIESFKREFILIF